MAVTTTTPEMPAKGPSLFLRALMAVPVLGYAIRCFAEERVNELLWLAFAGFLAVAVAVLTFGWPAFIVLILSLTALAGLVILSATFV